MQPRRASKTCTLSPKVRPQDPGGRQKHVPSAKKCVKNTYPQPESPPPGPRRASKTRTLSQKLRQKRVPSARKSAPRAPGGAKNAYPQPKSASKTRTLSPKVRSLFTIRTTGGVHSIGVNFRKSKKHPDVSAKCTGVQSADPRSVCQISFGGEVYLSPTPATDNFSQRSVTYPR